MIDLEFVERLIRTLDESGLDHVEVERGGTRVRVSRSPAHAAPLPAVRAPEEAAPPRSEASPASDTQTQSPGPSSGAPEVPAEGLDWIEVASPMVGTFYRSASPGSEAFADVGSKIAVGDTLCIIEAMKLMNELESDTDGIVREICVENGEPVEYGQVLFRVEAI